MTLFITGFVVNELSLHAVGKVLVAGRKGKKKRWGGGDGQISSIRAIHGTEKANFDHQPEPLLYRTPFGGVKSQLNLRVVQKSLNELFQLHRGIESHWMKSTHPTEFVSSRSSGNLRASHGVYVCGIVCSREAPLFIIGICAVFEKGRNSGSVVPWEVNINCE